MARTTFQFKIIPKAFFFDRARVLAVTDRATNIYLGRAGGFVRQTAQRSMRKARRMRISELSGDDLLDYKRARAIRKRLGQKPPALPMVGSKPGKPPRVRQGDLKRHIYYAYEGDRRSVVIGPLGFRKSIVPSVLEYGGQAVKSGGGHYTMAPRPYMRPALDKALPRMPGWWAEAFRRTAARGA